MKKQLFIFGALGCAALFAQAPEPKGALAYQNISVMGGPGGGHMLKMLGPEGPTVTGKPFSATEQHHSLQVLADGTRIENNETNTFYRDDQGRTRNEHGPAGETHVMIHDPVAGYSVVLDPSHKIAHKLAGLAHLPGMPPPPAEGASAGGHHGPQMAMVTATATATAGGGNFIFRREEMDLKDAAKEDLGTDTINGVLAQGTRTTMRIPAGQIGNDRPIQVVNERWYSSELQTLVKSSNKDPRFGETTFELTNIDRTPPAAALFQIPADYTIDEGGELGLGGMRVVEHVK